MIGAIPYLVRDGINGLIYRDGNRDEMFRLAEKLVGDRELCRTFGTNAYATITECWNAENAALSLIRLCGKLGLLTENIPAEAGSSGYPAPCMPTRPISERKMYRLLKKGKIH